jgi:hypothetical protein
MERLGIPAALIITEPFQGLAVRFSQTLGLAGYPAVVVPHPVSSMSDQALDRTADAVVDHVVDRLTSG